jgi:murein DD-endopeptidase MepM/ murein hydrolase activator NlpD
VEKFHFQPISPFRVTQYFGENKACIKLDGTKGVITCDGKNPPPGYKALYDMRGHLGIDLSTTHGQPVYAACSGRVSSIDTNPKSGLDVRVTLTFGGKVYRYINEHLLGYQVKEGQDVAIGDLIGWADNTGFSSGDHLHFQLEEWRNDKWVPIDPIPLMEPTFSLKYAGLVRQIRELTARVAEWIADLARKNK